jgi:hypothetical protein
MDDAVVWAGALNLAMHGAIVINPLEFEGVEYPQDLLGPIEERLARRVALGSVTTGVVGLAYCPVLVRGPA